MFRPAGLKPIADLVRISLEKGPTNKKIALSILVNVSDDDAVRKYLITEQESFVPHILGKIKNDDENVALYTMLLANLSFNSNLKITPEMASMLLEKYVQNKPHHDYLSYVFVNYTNNLEGREFFLKDDNLLSIIVFNESDNQKRKEGGSKVLKNILFNSEHHLRLVEDEKIKLLTYILGPMISSQYTLDDDEMFALPDELQFLEDKELEKDNDLIAVYLECLFLLCTTRPVRIILREKSVYPVIRELHKMNSYPRVQELCEELVQFLARDEAPEEDEVQAIEDEEDLDDDKIIEVL